MIKKGLQNLFPLSLMSSCLLSLNILTAVYGKKKKKPCKNLYANDFAILLIGR